MSIRLFLLFFLIQDGLDWGALAEERGAARLSPLFSFNSTDMDRKAKKTKKKKDPCDKKSKKNDPLPEECLPTSAPVTNAPVTNAPVTNAPVTNAPVLQEPPVINLTCSEQDPTPFNKETSLPYFGRPLRFTMTELMILKRIFIDTYNLVVADCPEGSFRRLDNVQIVPPTIQSNLSIAYPFSLTHRVSFSCRGCDSNATFLFSEDQANITEIALGSQRYLQHTHDYLVDNSHDAYARQMVGLEMITPGPGRLLQGLEMSMAPSFSPIINLETCPECPGPSSAFFIGNYSALLQEYISNGTISSIDSLGGEPIEVEAIDCDTTLDEFVSNVFVDFTIRNASALPTVAEQRALEETFLLSYNFLNGVNNETCDPQFRRVLQVEFVESDASYSRRQLQEVAQDETPCNNITNTSDADSACNALGVPARLQLPQAFLFRVRGRCRGCKTERSLFDEGLRRRILSQDIPVLPLMQATFSHDHRELQQLFEPSNPNNTDECVCAVEAPEIRAPTRAEFAAVYNETVTNLVEEGEVEFVESVVEVAETEQVECAEETEFITQLLIQFNGFPAMLDDTEEEYINEVFVFSYNDVSEIFCDDKFRKLELVRVAQLLDANGDIIDRDNVPNPDANVPFTIVFETIGRCRGCEPNSKLFDDTGEATGRRLALQHGRPHGHLPRRIEEDDACYCDIEFVDTRAPTEDEFSDELKRTVSRLNLNSIQEVLDVEETNPTATPTLTPTTSAPSPLNNDLFEELLNAPFQLDQEVFGDRSQFPIYALDSRPDTTGTYTGTRTSDGAAFSLQVTNIVLPWSELQSQEASNGGAESDLVDGIMIGLTAEPIALGALIVSTIDDAGNLLQVQMVPLLDPSALPVRLRALTAFSQDMATQNLFLPDNPASRSLQSDVSCANFVEEAFLGHQCLGENTIVDQACVEAQQDSYLFAFNPIEEARAKLEDTRASSLRQILITKLLQMADGIVACGDSTDPSFFGCLDTMHRRVARVETNSRVELNDWYGDQLSALNEDEQMLCDGVRRGKITDCFSCGPCLVDQVNTGCCSQDECIPDGLCVAATCLTDGTPRFTLEWRGDDDLSLVVITPDNTELSSASPTDAVTGGQWERSLRSEGLGEYFESVSFGHVPPLGRQAAFAPNGDYTFSIAATQAGLTSDTWTVTVYVDGAAVMTQTGSGASEQIQFEFVRPTDPPSQMPSSFPTESLPPSALPSVATDHPSREPTSLPSANPSGVLPSSQPSGPTSFPSHLPSTFAPSISTGVPSGAPSVVTDSPSTTFPSIAPSVEAPSQVPSFEKPSFEPSTTVSSIPSESSFQPSVSTDAPTKAPTDILETELEASDAPSTSSAPPSLQASAFPSSKPSELPSMLPSVLPTILPTSVPSSSPSSGPSMTPTPQPTPQPTPPLTAPPSVSFEPSQSILPSSSSMPTVCIAGVGGTQCCADGVTSECDPFPRGQHCFQAQCVGYMQIDFTWFTADDADIRFTAFYGNQISYQNPFDEASGGYLVRDVIPSGPGRHTESIIVPSARNGIYEMEWTYNTKTGGDTTVDPPFEIYGYIFGDRTPGGFYSRLLDWHVGNRIVFRLTIFGEQLL